MAPSLWNCLRKSNENWHVECEFHCEIPFSDGHPLRCPPLAPQCMLQVVLWLETIFVWVLLGGCRTSQKLLRTSPNFPRSSLSPLSSCSCPSFFDTDYDRWRFHHTMEVIPALPWKSKPICLHAYETKFARRERKGCEHGTARKFLHSFHCPAPRSSSHVG